MAYRAMEAQMPEQCRICMSSWAAGNDTTWRNIFTGADSSALLHIIKEVTGQEVKQDGSFPQSICPSCLDAATIAYNFKWRLNKSLMRLNQLNFTSFLNREVVKQEDVSDQKYLESKEDYFNSFSLVPFAFTNERPFQCSLCCKTFAYSRSLKYHLMRHKGERPFKCSHCLKTFTTSSRLRSHRRTHTADRPFKCTYCSKTFVYIGILKRHLDTHTGENRLNSSQRSRTITQRSSPEYQLRSRSKEVKKPNARKAPKVRH